MSLEITAIKCASCKAPLEIYSESTKVIRCKYCDFVNRINFKGETDVLVDAGESYASVVRTVMKDRIKGKKVVLQMSGCNASPDEVEKAISYPVFRHGIVL